MFITLDTSGGGAERVVQQAVSALSLHCVGEFGIASLRGKPQDWEYTADFAIAGIATAWPKPAGLVRYALQIRRLAREFGVTALVTNSFGLSRITLILAKLRIVRYPIIVVEHSTLSAKLAGLNRSRVMRIAHLGLTRWLYRRASAIVGVSLGVSRDLEDALGLPHGSVTTIQNPVDTKRITDAIEAPVLDRLERQFNELARPVVITAGRLVLAKAHRDLLEAFAQLPENHRGSLVILGEGPLREALKQQAIDLKISDRVWMPGFVENPWWFIARADVFALSSHWEGHSQVVLEALACGVAIASTDCPSGPREILADAAGTRLVPVGDTRALSRAMQQLLEHPEGIDVDLVPYQPEHVARRYLHVVSRAVE